MKRRILALLILAVILILSLESFVSAPTWSFSSPFGFAADPAGNGYTCANCHLGPPVTSKSGWITTNVPATGYVPGTSYTITATATGPGHSKFGFEITPQNASGVFLGSLSNLNSSTQLYFDANEPRISHSNIGTSGSDSRTWTFQWTAPAAGSGPVTLYGAFNISNNDQSGQGDTIYTSQAIIQENSSVGMSELASAAADRLSLQISASAGVLQVSFLLSKPGLVSMTLTDAQGKSSVLQAASPYAAGFATQRFNLQGKYAPGVYFLELKAGENTVLRKVLLAD